MRHHKLPALVLCFFLTVFSTIAQHSYTPINPTIDSLLRQAGDSIYSSSLFTCQCLEKAWILADSLGIPEDKIDVLTAYGNYYSGKKQFFLSTEYLLKALSLSESCRFTGKQAKILDIIGFNYLIIHQYDQALPLFHDALSLAGKENNSNLIAQIHIDIGRLLYEKGQYNESLVQYLNALATKPLLTDARVVGNIYRGLGTVYFYLARYNWSLYYFQQAVNQSKRFDLTSDLGSIYTLISHVYQSLNDFPHALDYNRKALLVRKQIGFNEHIASSLVNLGNLFLVDHQLDSAHWYIEKGIRLLSGSIDYHLKTYAYKQYLDLLIAQKRYKQAVTASLLYHAAYDSLLIINRQGEINRIETNYRIAEMQKQNALLQQELEIHKLQLKNQEYIDFILQLALLLGFLLIILFVYLQERNNREKRQLEEINRQMDEEIQERKRTESRLRKSEKLYRFLTNNTLDGIIHMDRQLHYLFISPSMEKMFGYSVADITTFPPLDNLIHSDFLDEMELQYKNLIRLQKPITFTHMAVRRDGSLFWAESLMNPVFDEQTNRLRETITVIRDVSERIAFEKALQSSIDQNKLLMREIHHRVKNNFAILISLMDLQERHSGKMDYDKLFTDLQQRIRTMSAVHEILYRSNDISSIQLKDYLMRLIEIISLSYRKSTVKLIHHLEPCVMDIDSAIPVALILNEVLTNAYKHAFSQVSEGTLWITLERIPESRSQAQEIRYRLEIRDNGPGLPEGFSLDQKASMGSYLMLMLTTQIEGILTYENKGGACFTITFPVSIK